MVFYYFFGFFVFFKFRFICGRVVIIVVGRVVFFLVGFGLYFFGVEVRNLGFVLRVVLVVFLVVVAVGVSNGGRRGFLVFIGLGKGFCFRLKGMVILLKWKLERRVVY